MTDLIHPGAANIERLLSLMPEAQRERTALMERVRAEYLSVERDDEVAMQFEWMTTSVGGRVFPDEPYGPGNRVECRSVVVVGDSGAGKTTLMRQRFKNTPAFGNYRDRQASRILVSVDLPSPCTLQALGGAILEELGFSPDRALGEAVVWTRVRRTLERRGVLILHLDECHNVTETANKTDMRKIRKTLKMLMANRRWPVALIVTGLPQLTEIMETVVVEPVKGCFKVDPVDRVAEVRRRCRFVELKPLALPDDIAVVTEGCRGLADLAGLGIADGFDAEVAPRLIHAAGYQFGTCLEFIQDTIEMVLTGEPGNGATGERPLSRAVFAEAWALRTANDASMNPFLVADWASLDCTAVLNRSKLAIVANAAAVTGLPR